MADVAARAASRPRRWSLVVRLTTWYAAGALVTVLLIGGLSYLALVYTLDREDDQLLADKAHIIRTLLRERPEDVAELRQEVEWGVAARRSGAVLIRVFAEGGGVRIETPGMEASMPSSLWLWPSPPASLSSLSPARDLRLAPGRRYRVATMRTPVGPTGRDVRVVQIALDRSQEMAVLARYRWWLVLCLVAALMLASAVGHEVARRGVRPVEDMARSARRIHSGTLGERLSTADMPAELRELAETFNDTFDRLDRSFARLSRFAADIAHELRTPIQNLRGEAEVALNHVRTPEQYRDVLGSTLEECGKLSRLIDSLLFLARSESPEVCIEREALQVGRELEALGDFYEAAAADKGVRLEVRCPVELAAVWDRALVQRALGNLISNALGHTPSGGSVTLEAAAEREGVSLTVTDTGRGIPAEHLPHVFDRFYRVDASRSAASGGVGLGLPIVKGIVTLHGGTVQLDSQVGAGTRVSLWLPRDGPVPRGDATGDSAHG